jgi:alanine racemase
VNLNEVVANFRTFVRLAGDATVGAVVKADAYGLGVTEVAPALYATGCTDFFVAFVSEGAALRELIPQARIFVLSGLMAGSQEAMAKWGLIPVLTSIDEVHTWDRTCAVSQATAAAVHVDTGMSRLGVKSHDIQSLAEALRKANSFDLVLILSHLASSCPPTRRSYE